MDIIEIRRLNLSRVIGNRTKAAVAERWGTSPSTLSQITSQNASRNLGNGLARRIEEAEGLSKGWMDSLHDEQADSQSAASSEDEIKILNTEIIEDTAPLSPDEVMLPIFREVEFAAGDGRTQVIENHGAQERFSLSKLSKKGVQPENAALAVAAGDSMETTILDGATLGIDKGTQYIIDGKIYALDHGGMLRIKRLYRLPIGRIRVTSDNNSDYPEEVYHMNSEDAPRIIGRVFWWENFD